MLKKENVYIKLQGKSKEELTELYNFLESVGEEIFRNDIEWFLEYSELDKDYAHLSYRTDDKNWGNLKTHNKQEVTIQQLKEILQPMNNKGQQLIEEAKRRGYAKGNFKCLIGFDRAVHENIDEWHYEQSEDRLYTMPDGYGGNVVYKEGVWAEIVSEYLEQQLKKAKAEVERLEKTIEESKIKIGDWVISELNDCVFRYQYGRVEYDLTKITDQELINKLNELIK